MKTYKSLSELIAAVESREIPVDVVSPGGAAKMLGVSRQAINDRLYNGNSLEAWGTEGYILISTDSVKLALKKKIAASKKGV